MEPIAAGHSQAVLYGEVHGRSVQSYDCGQKSLAYCSMADGESNVGGTHGREGVVVRPLIERTDPAIGWVILKYVGDMYLFGQRQDFTDQ